MECGIEMDVTRKSLRKNNFKFVFRKQISSGDKMNVRNMIFIGLFAILTFTAGSLSAADFDHGVAAEAVRGTSIADAMGTMTDNQQLRLEYQRILTEQAISVEAARLGLTERLDVQHGLQAARRGVLVSSMRREVTKNIPLPGLTAVTAAYSNNLARWIVPETALVDIVQMSTNDDRTVAAATSVITNKPGNADRPMPEGVSMIIAGRWLRAVDLPVPVWNTISGMSKGDTEFCQAGDSYLIISLHARQLIRTNSLAAARGTIEIEMLRAEEEKVWQSYIKSVRKRLGL